MQLPTNLLDRVNQKQLIFVFSTGRCGTQLLQKIMDLQPRVHAVHESPLRLDNVRYQFVDSPDACLDWLARYKLPEIAAVGDEEPIYFESSHLICKDLLIPMLSLGVKFKLLFLDRPIHEVAVSMYHLNDVPGRSKTGMRWYLNPKSDNNIAPIDVDSYTDIQLCIWYCLEMAARAECFHISLSHLGWVGWSFSLNDLLSYNHVQALWSALKLDSLRYSTDYYRLLRVKCNDKIARKWHLSVRGVVPHLGPTFNMNSELAYMKSKYKEHINPERREFYRNIHKLYPGKE
jgi:hypothetical protein